MKHIFKDPTIQESYDRDGYAKFPLLDKLRCQALIESYEGLKASLPFYNGLHITAEMATAEIKERVREDITRIIRPSIDGTFQNHRCIMGSFLMKQANRPQNKIGVQQDWTFVPEEQGFTSGTLWIALNDIPKERGGIGFIPGSHLWSEHYRYSPIELAYNPFYEHPDLLMQNLKFETMKAGEAILWNHRVLHGSVGNTTDEDRMVAGLSILPDDAELQFHYQLPGVDGQIGVFDVEESFYLKYRSHDFHEHYLAGTTPDNMVAQKTYERVETHFDASKLERVLSRADHDKVKLGDLQKDQKVDTSLGLINRIRSLFSS